MKLKKSDINAIIKRAVDNEVKKKELKARGKCLFKREGDYFIMMLIGISGMKGEKISIFSTIKPFSIDDVFWEVFQMPENSKQPIGLRANGAFKVDGLRVYDKAMEYVTVDDIEKISSEMISDCLSEVKEILAEFNCYEDYLKFAQTVDKPGLFDCDLVNMLMLIEKGQYEQAKVIAEELISKKKYGRFQNNGKDIYVHIVDYCGEHMVN